MCIVITDNHACIASWIPTKQIPIPIGKDYSERNALCLNVNSGKHWRNS